jgi:hypothetical protein
MYVKLHIASQNNYWIAQGDLYELKLLVFICSFFRVSPSSKGFEWENSQFSSQGNSDTCQSSTAHSIKQYSTIGVP